MTPLFPAMLEMAEAYVQSFVTEKFVIFLFFFKWSKRIEPLIFNAVFIEFALWTCPHGML